MPEKTVAQKLMLKPGRRALLVDPPEDWQALLGPVPDGVEIKTEVLGPADWILVFVHDRQALERQLPRLKAKLGPAGQLWVAYHKGTSKTKTDIHRDTINAYAKSLGLVGIAMISMDDDWSALRLKFDG